MQPKSERAKPESGESSSLSIPKKIVASKKPWSRLDQALRITDLLLQNGGFAAVVLDMGDIVPAHALRVPLATWFRYRAVAAQKQTSVVLLLQHPCAKSSAALTLRLHAGNPRSEATVFTGLDFFAEVERQRFWPGAEEFPAQALLRLRPTLRNHPCVVMDGEPLLRLVCSLNRGASKLGIVRGMTQVEMDTFPQVKILSRS